MNWILWRLEIGMQLQYYTDALVMLYELFIS